MRYQRLEASKTETCFLLVLMAGVQDQGDSCEVSSETVGKDLFQDSPVLVEGNLLTMPSTVFPVSMCRFSLPESYKDRVHANGLI